MLNQFDLIANAYAKKVEVSPYNAFYERPAMLALIGDVAGQAVLDVGCGPGVYLDLFLKKGAKEVVGFDISEEMINISRNRVGTKAELYIADVSKPLSFIPEAHFDLVVGSLVLHYVEDLYPVFLQLKRKMKNGGKLVFSLSHPFPDFMESKSGNYHQTEIIEELWPSFNVTIKIYRRSLMSVFESFKKAGFRLQSLVEPKPLPDLEAINPQAYQKLLEKPGFICFELISTNND